MKKIGIIGAMKVEVDYLHNLMLSEDSSASSVVAGGMTFETGKIHGVDVVLCQSGVGKVNAALCAQLLAQIIQL